MLTATPCSVGLPSDSWLLITFTCPQPLLSLDCSFPSPALSHFCFPDFSCPTPVVSPLIYTSILPLVPCQIVVIDTCCLVLSLMPVVSLLCDSAFYLSSTFDFLLSKEFYVPPYLDSCSFPLGLSFCLTTPHDIDGFKSEVFSHYFIRAVRGI